LDNVGDQSKRITDQPPLAISAGLNTGGPAGRGSAKLLPFPPTNAGPSASYGRVNSEKGYRKIYGEQGGINKKRSAVRRFWGRAITLKSIMRAYRTPKKVRQNPGFLGRGANGKKWWSAQGPVTVNDGRKDLAPRRDLTWDKAQRL